jgi:uncharacterized protein YqgV (UPF0045/DUF77 family)
VPSAGENALLHSRLRRCRDALSMARSCTACGHSQRATIDEALVAGASSNRRIATQFGLTEAGVRRHAAAHLPQALTLAQDAQEVSQADQLLEQVRQRLERADKHVGIAEGLCARAANTGDIRGAVAAVSAAVNANREVRSILELLGKLQGQIQEQATMVVATQINIDYRKMSDQELEEQIERQTRAGGWVKPGEVAEARRGR